MSETRPPESADPDQLWASLEPAEPPKRVGPKIDWLFLVLGFFTPVVLYVLVSFGDQSGFLGVLVPWVFIAHFALCLIMLGVGRQNEVRRLRSYGLGGIVFYGLTVLALLLLFGSCLLFYKP